MRIVLGCSSRRGLLFLRKLRELSAQSDLTVFSFREEPWEPPFFDEIQGWARSCGADFFETRDLGAHRWKHFWESTAVDLMLFVGWRYIVPPNIFRRPRLGTFVFHDSMLPQYRGFSPTVWAIMNGEDHTGVTLFEIADEVDAGPIIDQQRIAIGYDDTIATVIENVTQCYLEVLERNLPLLVNGSSIRHAQDHSRATYVCKRLPDDNRIDWSLSSERIYNLIRAVSSPYPGAYTHLVGQKLYVWEARNLTTDARHFVGKVPGRVVEVRPNEGSVVLTGDGSLLLTRLQVEDGKITCASEVLKSLSQTLGP